MAVLEACVADGWPFIQIQRTHHVGQLTLRRLFPHYRGMPLQEAARLGAAAKRANQQMRRTR